MAILLALPGCMGPVRWNGGRERNSGAGASVTSKARDTQTASAGLSDDPHGPAYRLTVNSETAEAAELTAVLSQEIREKAATLPLEAFRAYAVRESLSLTRDKIAEMLLYQKASLRLTDRQKEALDRMVEAELRRRVSGQAGGVQWEYEKQLADHDSTLEAEKQKIRREIAIHAHLEQNVQPLIQAPTRDELMVLYDRARAEQDRPERRRMSLIEIDVLDQLRKMGGPSSSDGQPTRDELAAARAEAVRIAESLLERLKAGASFAELAREHSDGLQAPKGGAWDPVARDSLRARWQPAVDALFNLDVGGISEPIVTEETVFLVRCDEIDRPTETSFESMQPQLTERFRSEKYAARVGDLVEQLFQQARIDPPDVNRFVRGVYLEIMSRAGLPP